MLLRPLYQHEYLDYITGLVDRVTFHRVESGFAVLRVKVSGQQQLITVVGTLPSTRAHYVTVCPKPQCLNQALASSAVTVASA